MDVLRMGVDNLGAAAGALELPWRVPVDGGWLDDAASSYLHAPTCWDLRMLIVPGL
jgi:hypothetical protein